MSHQLHQRPLESHRLGVLLSHPIQYLSPWLRELAGRVRLKVYYLHRQGAEEQARAGFSRPFVWDVSLLEGYDHEWLVNAARRPRVDRFLGCRLKDFDSVIARDGLDSLLVFGWRHMSSWQALRACRRAGVKVLMRGDSTLEMQRSAWLVPPKRLVYPPLLRLFDAHLYVGEGNRRYLERFGVAPERLYFVPHAVDTESFRERARAARDAGRAAALRREAGISAGAHVYLFVGKLIARKRVSDLLAAFDLVRRRHPGWDIHTVVVGDGPLGEALRARASDPRVHFAGFRNQSELPDWYAMADTLVLPGGDTWGLVVNEAAACGLPAIVSDRVGCHHDMIDERLTGRVFPVGDTSRLASAMIDMHAPMPDVRAAIAARLEAKCRDYGLESAARGVCAALAELHRHAGGAARRTCEDGATAAIATAADGARRRPT